jgi:hypothetical protein
MDAVWSRLWKHPEINCKWLSSFLYLRPQWPRNRRLGEFQGWSGGCGKEQATLPCRESNHDSSVIQHIAGHYTDWAIPAPRIIM